MQSDILFAAMRINSVLGVGVQWGGIKDEYVDIQPR